MTYVSWVWNWKEWSDDLFKDYIRTFLKLKVESDWDENLPEEVKQQFIDDYWEKFQIRLEPQNMKKNAGMRYISKLCLNSVRFLNRFLKW